MHHSFYSNVTIYKFNKGDQPDYTVWMMYGALISVTLSWTSLVPAAACISRCFISSNSSGAHCQLFSLLENQPSQSELRVVVSWPSEIATLQFRYFLSWHTKERVNCSYPVLPLTISVATENNFNTMFKSITSEWLEQNNLPT